MVKQKEEKQKEQFATIISAIRSTKKKKKRKGPCQIVSVRHAVRFESYNVVEGVGNLSANCLPSCIAS
jgi:hypothetical protein